MGRKRYKSRQTIPRLSKPSEPGPEPATIARIQAEYFSGPLPPPSLLARYNDVVPDGADRILAMAERQSAHRESLESKVVDGNLELQKQGSNRAFVLAFVIILGGIYLMATGKDAWGFAAIIASITSLVSVFAISKAQQKKERVEKSVALRSRREN